MKSPTDAAALSWRAPPAVASPWRRRRSGLWALIVQSWRQSMDIYARGAPYRLPWSPFP
jgi:hypothetical protein